MIIQVFIYSILLIESIRAQYTFGTLSSSGIKVTTSTISSVTNTPISFGTLSSASSSTPNQATNSGGTNFCASNPCTNAGLCVDLDPKNGACVCTSSFTGRFCESKINVVITTTSTVTPVVTSFCSRNTCRNGGLCIDLDPKV